MKIEKQTKNKPQRLAADRRARTIDWVTVAVIVTLLATVTMIIVSLRTRSAIVEQKLQLEKSAETIEVNPDIRQEQIAQLEGAFLPEDGVIAFIQAMDAVRPGFDSLELNFTSDVSLQNGAVSYLPVMIVAEGRRATAEGFLQELFSSRYIFEIDEYTLEKDSKSASESKLTLRAKLYISEK